MKRIFSFAAAAALLFGAASCQKALTPGQEGDCKVSFSVVIPDDVVTKADMGDGSTVDQLVWEVYSGASDKPAYEGVINDFVINNDGKKQFVLELKLVTGLTYDLLFWAQKKNPNVDDPNSSESRNYYYNTNDLRCVSTNYKDPANGEVNAKANDEARDAFYGSYPGFTPQEIASNEDVILRRPFAQINFGTTKEDWDNAQPFIEGVGLKSSFELTGVPTTLNVLDGSVSGSANVTFDYSLCPASESVYGNNEIQYKGIKYAWIGMNYIFAPREKSTMNEVVGHFVHKGNNVNSDLEKNVLNVPFRQNYKTNILGQIFTGGNTFNVIIEPGFITPDHDAPDYNIVDPIEEVIKKGGTFSLTSDMTISKPFILNREAKVVINLNSYTLTYTGGDILFRCPSSSWLTFRGDGNVVANGYIASTTELGGRIVVESGTFETTDATTFQVYGGDMIINGGSFKSEPYNGTYFTLNKIDNGSGTITVNAGRFYKYDPSNSYTEPNGPVSFIPYDRKVTKEGDWFVVSYNN